MTPDASRLAVETNETSKMATAMSVFLWKCSRWLSRQCRRRARNTRVPGNMHSWSPRRWHKENGLFCLRACWGLCWLTVYNLGNINVVQYCAGSNFPRPPSRQYCGFQIPDAPPRALTALLPTSDIPNAEVLVAVAMTPATSPFGEYSIVRARRRRKSSCR